MADIAELGYKVDSSGLVEGTKALDDNAAAAEKAGIAAERLEKSQRDTGKSASFWANEQAKINARVQEMERIEQKTAAATQQAARATEARELNLQKLLGQIDPTVAALNKLAEQEDKLSRARDLGLLKPQVWQQYQTQLDGTRAGILATSNSFGKLNLQTVEAQQSVALLFRALATGNFAQVQSSVMGLTARSGLMASAFTGAGLAAGGLAMAIGAAGAAAVKGYLEMRDLERVVIAIGGAAGAISGGLMNARSEIGRLTGDYKAAGEAIGQVLQGGRLFSQQAASVASSAVSIASLTGQSISSVTSSIMGLADGGSDALVKLNQQYGFLTVATYNQIEAIRQERGDGVALQATIIELEKVSRDRVKQMEESAGSLERAWRGVKREIGDVWQMMKDSGRTDIEHQLTVAMATLNRARQSQHQDSNLFGIGDMFDGLKSRRAAEAEVEVARLLGVRMEMQEKELADERKRARDKEVIEVQAAAKIESKAAAEALDARLAGLDRESAKLLARNKIIELYNKLDVDTYDSKGKKLPPDSRLLDGSMERLIARSNADIDKQFNKRDGVGKKNADDNSVQTFIANVERQITANQQLAESGDKVTASDRMVIQARQMLADKTNNMTAATRLLLEAVIPQLQASDEAAVKEQQRRKDMAANIALTERLTQVERLRSQQADADLLGIGQGADASEMLRRQLEIQRQYLQEREKLEKAQRDKNTALSQAEYQGQVTMLEASLQRSLDIERNYQERRAAMLGDWRTGVNRVWADYVSAAGNASDQAGSLVSNSLSGMEDALVRFAQTGKLSFTSLANSIIADLARIATKQAAVGIFNAMSGAWGGGSATSSTYSAQSFGNNTGWLNEGISFGGGRARGGPVSGSSLYEVGEGGKPELFNDGRGRTYLIPGNNGNVVPAAPTSKGNAGAAAPAPQFNITINGAPGGGAATAKPNQSGGADIEVMLDQMEGRIAGNFAQGVSPLNSALEGRYDVAARV